MRARLLRPLAPILACLLFTVVFVVGTHDHTEGTQRHPCMTCVVGSAVATTASPTVLPEPSLPLLEPVPDPVQVPDGAFASSVPLGRAPPRS